MSDLVFADKKTDAFPHGFWKVLIVDDDPGIHAITKTVLRDLLYENRTLVFLSAYSRAEAVSVLESEEDIALILLDVVMEEEDSGLRLVQYIREELTDSLVRIVLRTGQPGKAPSQKVIIDYDINDYEEKTDLTAQKLFTTVIASLRNYRDLQVLESNRANLSRHRAGLTTISHASGELFGARTTRDFSLAAYGQLLSLLGSGGGKASSFVALQDESEFEVIRGGGEFAGREGAAPRMLIGEASLESLRALKRENRSLLIQEGAVHLYEDARKYRLLLYMSGVGRLEFLDRQILDIFASNVSLAFENLRLNREIIGTQEDLMMRLGGIVETRSHDTEQHVVRMGEYCGLLAERIGMDAEYIHDLKLAAALHDIGKIGIPDDILLKPDVLSDEEFEVVKNHTIIGYNLLRTSSRPLLQKAAVISLQHHEKYDGSGYPAGLKGEGIHIDARISSICDVFDSLSHERTHREPWSLERIIDFMKEQRGRAFDPTLLDLFLEMIGEMTKSPR